MDKFQKEVIQAQLNNEKECLEALEQAYKNALDDINGKIADLKGRDDADLQHVIYQVQYQEALKKQMESSLDILQTQNFESVSQYLTTCYEEGYVGTIYNLQNQGIPLIFPIDQAQVVDAVTHDTKLSTDLYTALGKDIAKLKKDISSEISRGISTGMTYTDIAKNVSRYAGISKSNATRIARTEGHRIASKATMNACEKAKDMGADIVKQWDATLDGRTRPSHRSVDGEIREVDEAFSNGLMYPSDPDGGASESINCRCVLLEMPRWALNGKFTKRDGFSDEILEFDSYKDYDDFKNKYWSKENIQYMNYVDKLETRYNTKNFESILTNMTDREYKHYAKLLESNPMYKSSSVTQIAQKMNEGTIKGSGQKGDILNGTRIDSVRKFDYNDDKAMKKEIEAFMEKYKESDIEHNIVFTRSNKVFELTGTNATVDARVIGEEELVGSIGSHNHPIFEGFDRGDAHSVNDVIFAIKHRTGEEYVPTGNKKFYFKYTGEMNAEEMTKAYKEAMNEVLDKAFQNGEIVDFRQEETMKRLAQTIEGFEFYEL